MLQPGKRRVRSGRPPSIPSQRVAAFRRELTVPSKPLPSLDLTKRSGLPTRTENGNEQT
jgi:hypothetical protein